MLIQVSLTDDTSFSQSKDTSTETPVYNNSKNNSSRPRSTRTAHLDCASHFKPLCTMKHKARLSVSTQRSNFTWSCILYLHVSCKRIVGMNVKKKKLYIHIYISHCKNVTKASY